MSISSLFLLVAMIVLASCGPRKSSNAPVDQGDGLIPTVYFRPVFYSENQICSANDLRDVKTDKGSVITTLCLVDFKACLQEGSCDVVDHGVRKSLGYGGKQKDGTYAFVEIDRNRCPYGYGVKNICLDPFFSIAADMAFYKAGDVLFIPKLVGVTMPDGQIHDGYLIIRDEGGGIIGEKRFDFFTGLLNYTDKTNVMTKLGFSDPDNRIPFQKVVDEDRAKLVRQRRNYPDIPPAVLAEALR